MMIGKPQTDLSTRDDPSRSHVQEISRLLDLGFGFGFDRAFVDHRFVLGVCLSTAQAVRALKLAVQ